jgi:hypothetical protein
MRKLPLWISALLLSASIAQPLGAANQESAQFRLSGIVHTICRLEFSGYGTPQDEGLIDFGAFTQLCNARSGYRVTMQHPANMTGAVLMIDGRAVPLSNGTETVIADENHAAFRTSNAQLDVRGVTVPLTNLSFRIDPKGAVY